MIYTISSIQGRFWKLLYTMKILRYLCYIFKPLSLFFSNQLKGKKGTVTNGMASKQKAEPKNQSKKNGVNGTNGTASLKRNNSSE